MAEREDLMNDDSASWGVVDQKKERGEKFEKVKGISKLFPREGETVRVIFVTTSPVNVNEHYLEGSKKSVLCTKESDGFCAYCGPNNKPGYKGYFMVMNRAYVEREQVDGEWREKRDPKTKKPMVGPKLQIYGRGTRDLVVLNDLRKKFGRLDGIEIEITKIGSGTSSTVTYSVVERSGDKAKLATLSGEEKKLLAGRSAAELKELTRTFLELQKPDMVDPAHDTEAKKPVGEGADWNDDDQDVNINVDDE